MSDEEPTQIPVDAPAPDATERVDIVSPEPDAEPAFTPPEAEAAVDEHPEIKVAGAFAGAFLFAKFLQRIGR